MGQRQKKNFIGSSMKNDISDMILDGSLEFAGVDDESGEIVYSFPKDNSFTDSEENQSYFFYDQVKEFIVNKDNKEKE
jgi:hypothetical protein